MSAQFPFTAVFTNEDELKVFVASHCVRLGLEPTWAPRPGESHEIDQAFYRLVCAERDYERSINQELRELLNKLRKELTER